MERAPASSAPACGCVVDPAASEAAQRRAVRLDAVARYGMWVLLLVGGLVGGDVRYGGWTAACAVGTARSVLLARRTGAFYHWAIGATFALATVSLALEGLGIAELPWWYAAFALTAVLALLAWRGRRGTPASDDVRDTP